MDWRNFPGRNTKIFRFLAFCWNFLKPNIEKIGYSMFFSVSLFVSFILTYLFYVFGGYAEILSILTLPVLLTALGYLANENALVLLGLLSTVSYLSGCFMYWSKAKGDKRPFVKSLAIFFGAGILITLFIWANNAVNPVSCSGDSDCVYGYEAYVMLHPTAPLFFRFPLNAVNPSPSSGYQRCEKNRCITPKELNYSEYNPIQCSRLLNMEPLPFSDACYVFSSMNRKDSSLCEKVYGNQNRFYCFNIAAERENDPRICDELGGKARDACKSYQAEKTANLSLCRTVEYVEAREDCLYGLAVNLSEKGLCDELQENKRERCYCSLAGVNGNKTLCDYITDNDTRNDCFYNAGVSKRDIASCDLASDDTRERCYREVAVELNDSSICGKIDSTYYRGGCFQDIAELKQDPSLCEKVPEGRLDECKKASAGGYPSPHHPYFECPHYNNWMNYYSVI